MLMIYLFLLMRLTKSSYYKTPSKNIQFLTLLMNKNKISFLDVPIDTNSNNNFTTSTSKNPLTPVPSILKVNAPSDIKKQLLITLYPIPN